VDYIPQVATFQVSTKNSITSFFYCQDTNGSPEKLILLKEKNNIRMEVKKNMAIININSHAG